MSSLVEQLPKFDISSIPCYYGYIERIVMKRHEDTIIAIAGLVLGALFIIAGHMIGNGVY